jgi:hypothetical protein
MPTINTQPLESAKLMTKPTHKEAAVCAGGTVAMQVQVGETSNRLLTPKDVEVPSSLAGEPAFTKYEDLPSDIAAVRVGGATATRTLLGRELLGPSITTTVIT